MEAAVDEDDDDAERWRGRTTKLLSPAMVRWRGCSRMIWSMEHKGRRGPIQLDLVPDQIPDEEWEHSLIAATITTTLPPLHAATSK